MKLDTKYSLDEAWDPFNPPAGWTLVSDNGWSHVFEADLGDRVVQKTQFLHADKVLQEAERTRDIKSGQRWGDGQVVGSIPMNLYYASGMAEASRQRDVKFQRKFYREHPKLKKFHGDL
jgi:hypothetical protein